MMQGQGTLLLPPFLDGLLRDEVAPLSSLLVAPLPWLDDLWEVWLASL